MTYSGLLPTNEAIQQAVREPLSGAPRDHQGFAVYIFERARQIDHGRALSQAVEEQRAQAPRRTTPPNYASWAWFTETTRASHFIATASP